jgi:hypothetical protein
LLPEFGERGWSYHLSADLAMAVGVFFRYSSKAHKRIVLNRNLFGVAPPQLGCAGNE